MHIIVKNKDTLLYDEFKFKCSIGKKGVTSKKIEGDRKTPIGTYALGPLYFRKDRLLEPLTKLKKIQIKKSLGWCDDINSKFYNQVSFPTNSGDILILDLKLVHTSGLNKAKDRIKWSAQARFHVPSLIK